MATIESLAPVTETGEIELEVEGRLPAELAGSYLRDGPNRTPAQGIAGLWLDGQGMVSDGPTVHVVGCRRRVPGVHRGEENPFEASAGSLRRCSIDERTGGVEETDIDDDPCDFPSLFPGGGRVLVTRPTGGNYTVARGVSTIDLATGQSQEHEFGAGRFGGEMVSLGELGGRALVAGFVYDAGRDRTELLVLDAGDLAAGTVARLRLPLRVPYGLHGAWRPAGAA